MLSSGIIKCWPFRSELSKLTIGKDKKILMDMNSNIQGAWSQTFQSRLRRLLTLVGLAITRLPFSSSRGPSSASSIVSVSLLLAGVPLPCATTDPLWEDIWLVPQGLAASAWEKVGVSQPQGAEISLWQQTLNTNTNVKHVIIYSLQLHLHNVMLSKTQLIRPYPMPNCKS